MTPERWNELKHVLDRLLALDGESRAAYLCSLSDDVRQQAEEFVQASPEAFRELLPTEVGPGGKPAPQPEVLLGRYRIVRPLGRGAMGRVDLAHDLLLDCPVAIKRLRDAWLEDGEVRRRLLREGRALAVLDHLSIARVRDVLDTSPPALVMDYVEGVTLGAWAEAIHPATQVLDVLTQVAEAVAYAHDRDVVHCDLKPANVLVTHTGRVKVIDFGIALVLSRASTTVADELTRAVACTPKYAAPEVLRGDTPTPASDVYSFGVMIEEVLAICRTEGHPLPGALESTLLGVALRAQSAAPGERYPGGEALWRALSTPQHAPQARAANWRALTSTALLVGVGCISLVGDTSTRVAAASMPVLAVVTRVDPASAHTVSAAAAELVRQSLASVKSARIVTGSVAVLKGTHAELLENLKHKGLTHVVIPSVATMGPRVRVSVQVLRADDLRLERTVTRFGAKGELARLCSEVAYDLRTDWLGEVSARPSPPTHEPSPLSLGQYSEARRYAERADIPGQLETARGLLHQVVTREPAFTAAHAELGRVLYLMYREHPSPALLTQAVAAAETAVRQGPSVPEARIALAVLLQARGRRADGIAELHEVLRAFPNNDRALQLLGRYEAAEGHVDVGLELLERAVSLVPSWANYQALGNTLLRAGQFAQAVSRFEALTQLQPDNAWGYQMLGAAHQYQGDADASARAYRQSIAIRPIAETVSNLATLEFERNDFAEAARLYTQALALAPHDPLYARNLGDAERMRRRLPAAAAAYGTAIELARRLLDVNPNDAAVLSTASYASSRVARCDEAALFGTRAELAQPGALQPLANVANAHVLCGRVDHAARLLRGLRAAGHDPLPLLERDVKEQVLASQALKTAVGQR